MTRNERYTVCRELLDTAFFIFYAAGTSMMLNDFTEEEVIELAREMNDKWQPLENCETIDEATEYIESMERMVGGTDCGWN